MHADLDAFYASVEQRDDPALRGRPVLVGGGIIVAASYEAKRCGVRTPTNERAARRLCPDAVVVAPRFDAYLEASRAVFECFANTTPLVEGISIDEAFLDVGGASRLLGDPMTIAQRLRCEVRASTNLPLSVGVATTKFLAKVASASAKPDGILVVPAGEEAQFLHPLPVERMWGVGAKTSIKLAAIGVRSIADMVAVPEIALAYAIGNAAARHLLGLAHNQDPRVVRRTPRRRSIGSQSALRAPTFDLGSLEATLLSIVDRVARRLRADQRLARTVTLRVRFADFQRATRSATFAAPTDSTNEMARVALALLGANADLLRERGVTMLGLAASNLVPTNAVQLSLPFERKDQRPLDDAVDEIRARFGNTALTRAVLVDRASAEYSVGAALREHEERKR